MIKQYDLRNFSVRVFQQQKAGMNCCGDSYFVQETEEFIICGVADGLGSGKFAKEASKAAMDKVAASMDEPINSIMEKVNGSQLNLRGVVLSLFKIDKKNRQGYFCGMGNINMIINDDDALYAQPLPTRGYISGKPMQFSVREFSFPASGYFALFSDGIHIQSKQLSQLYRILGSPDENKAMANVDTCSVRNLNDDATLMIGKMI